MENKKIEKLARQYSEGLPNSWKPLIEQAFKAGLKIGIAEKVILRSQKRYTKEDVLSFAEWVENNGYTLHNLKNVKGETEVMYSKTLENQLIKPIELFIKWKNEKLN
jgi:hypothetical protein